MICSYGYLIALYIFIACYSFSLAFDSFYEKMYVNIRNFFFIGEEIVIRISGFGKLRWSSTESGYGQAP